MTTTAPEVYYDPYDLAIDRDPYPVWKRLRDEAPLYYNEKHDFYALSRFSDVEAGLADWETYSSSRSTLLEIIKAGFDMPPGAIINEDPPLHTKHRGLLRGVFTVRAIQALEPRIREFCAQALDPMIGTGGFDFIADLGAQMPMRMIGELLGIPEQDQVAIHDSIDASLKLGENGEPRLGMHDIAAQQAAMFADYVEWRAAHPSDDLMTQLLEAEMEDDDGHRRRLNRDEVLSCVNLLAAAGNETTTRLIGWTGRVLADHPDQRALLVDDPSLVGGAIEEVLRYEPPSPVQSRYVMRDAELHGQVVPAGSVMVLINGSANRDERAFPDPDCFDVRRKQERHLSFGFHIHFCLGAALARLEGRVALEEVLKRFPTWEVDEDNAVRAHTSTVRGWERLPVLVP